MHLSLCLWAKPFPLSGVPGSSCILQPYFQVPRQIASPKESFLSFQGKQKVLLGCPGYPVYDTKLGVFPVLSDCVWLCLLQASPPCDLASCLTLYYLERASCLRNICWIMNVLRDSGVWGFANWGRKSPKMYLSCVSDPEWALELWWWALRWGDG